MIKLIESTKPLMASEPVQIVGATTLYNGLASAAATGIDTRDMEDMTVHLLCGTYEGNASQVVTLMDSATDDATAATAVSSGAFSAITSANDRQIHNASLLTKNYKRYLFIQQVQTGTGTSITGIMVNGGHMDKLQDNSPVFDLNG